MLKQDTFEFIPDLHKHKELLSQILDGNVIIFVGNGISRLAGVPSWKELAHMYLEDWRENNNTDLSYDAYEKLKREKTDPLELLTICAGKIGKDTLKKKLFDKLNNSLRKEDKGKIKRIYGYIRDFHAGYITTNYDNYLETSTPASAITSEDPKTPDIDTSQKLTRVGLEDNLKDITDKIVYLHGKAIKPNTPYEDRVHNDIILTLEDYLIHYKDDEGLGKKFLKNIFENHVFLFIGFGLKEFEIIQHIKRPDNNHSHYILLGASDYEYSIKEQYEKYYRILNITPIFYNISQKGYHQLEDVLREWSATIRSAKEERIKEFKLSEKNIENLKAIKGLGNGTFK